jgi:intergrase/recombinase
VKILLQLQDLSGYLEKKDKFRLKIARIHEDYSRLSAFKYRLDRAWLGKTEEAEMDDYQKYEAECRVIRKVNKVLLDEFEGWLKASALSEKTISDHLSNIEFFINDYLLYEDACEAKEGVYEVSMFLGYWFIKKAMWASPASIKSNAASLKKFYAFMFEQGLVDKEALADLKQTIKEEMPEWLAAVRRFDKPEFEDIW